MTARFLCVLIATLMLSSCGGWRDSAANPRNWFNGDRAVEVPKDANPLLPPQSSSILGDADEDLSVMISVVQSMVVEQTPSGAIVRAQGLADRQGAYQVELRRDEDAEPDGVMAFEFRVVYPPKSTRVGPEATRQVRAAASVSRQDLQSISVIRVIGAENARETRRR